MGSTQETTQKTKVMDYKKLDEIAEKLEMKHIAGSAKDVQESKEILTMTQFYRIYAHNERKRFIALVTFMNEEYLNKGALDEETIVDDFLTHK